ncbi:sigma-70 family RNA polymerase sigma factor [Streptomyces albidochromogenes]|uniref:RNA polymerase sigma factor n=1 Tax=Streptomyces albidochromogenes TaxID=329524 RepID=A0ABW6FWA6_9ACTN
MGSEHEAATVRAAQGGDQRAQDELVTAYLPLVYNIVGRALSGHADVDDVVQETLIRALGGLGSLRDPASFRSWLVAITMNQIRDRWQARQADRSGGELDEAYELADPGADFVDLTIVRLGLSGQRREVAEATRWLDADDRALLSLWWLEAAGELTRAEVADAMRLSPQHTAVRVQRMKAQLETARVVVRALAAAPRCVLLDDALAAWDGVPSTLWRKRLARHARDCTICSGYGAELVPAEKLLVGLALIPVSAALAGAVLSGEHHTVGLAAAHGDASAQGAAAFPGDAPVRLGPAGRRQERHSRRMRRRRAVAASAAVLLVGGGGYTVLTLLEPGEAREATRSRAAAEAALPPVVAPTPPASPTSAAPTTRSASPRASASPSKKASRKTPRATPSRTTAKPSPRPVPPKPQPSSPARPAAPSSFAQQVTALVNTERGKNGCGPVSQNSRLDTAAQRHSADMAARDFFDHTNPDGAGPGERVTDAGYAWSTYGENIAMGQRTPAQVMESWMNSSGHRANILNCSFKEIGVGMHDASGGPWWTQVFGASR